MDALLTGQAQGLAPTIIRLICIVCAMNIFLSLLLALAFTAAPPDTTLSTRANPVDEVQKTRRGTFALTNARIVTVTDGVIEDGTVVIDGAEIVAVGADVEIPAGAEVIDCTGLSVYPGMIDSGTHLGLIEVGSLSLTRDYDELGELVPHMQALTAVNPNSVSIPVTRVNGVTTVLTEPAGSLLPGTAALIDLIGYTPRQMHLGGVEVVVLNFPSTMRRGPWDDRSEEKIEEEAEKALGKLNEVWDRAELYARIDSAYMAGAKEERLPEYAPSMKALAPVVRGEMPLMIKVNASADIRRAIAWVEERGLTDNTIFSGVAEGWRVADEIAEAGIPCLVGPVPSVPTRDSDRYDKAYANPGLMEEAGVTVAIRSGETENARNLPYHAGFADAYGMTHREALRAVTIVPARIFGVADLIGSIEEGKLANLFVATGDPFQTSTQIKHLFIEGYKVPLVSRQTRLYEEFLNRNPGLSREANPEITQPGNQSVGTEATGVR